MREEQSAKMPLRIPVSLHRALKLLARREGVSLNQYCLYLLARDSGKAPDLAREKGESLLKFLEETRVFQKELKKGDTRTKEISPKETCLKRWRKLYGKNRSRTH